MLARLWIFINISVITLSLALSFSVRKSRTSIAMNSELSGQVIQDGMKRHKLPNSDLEVTQLCIGTMNFGDQLSSQQSYEILDAARGEYGINFFVSSHTF